MKQPTFPAMLPAGGFAYEELPASVRRQVEGESLVIRRLLAKTAINIVQIGLRLRLVHAALGRNRFQRWLRAEFCWSQSLASRYMRAASAFENVECLERFQPSALYILAQGRCSPAAREEALDRARSGELITKSRAEAIVARHGPPGLTAAGSPMARVRTSVRRLTDQLAQLDEESLRDVVEELGSLIARLRAALTSAESSTVGDE